MLYIEERGIKLLSFFSLKVHHLTPSTEHNE